MTIKLKGSTDGSVSLTAPADTSPSGTDITLTLPTDAGSANQFLKNSGTAGTLDYSSMVETSTGIGIGTSTPASFLHIDSDNTYGSVVLSRDGGASGRRPFGIGISGSADDHLRISVSSDTTGANAFATQLIEITSEGNVGIGTTNPLVPFALSDDGNKNIEMGYSSGTTSHYIQAYNRSTSAYAQLDLAGSVLTFKTPTESMRIDSSGNVLVGTTSFPTGSANGCALNSTGQLSTSRGTTSAASHIVFYNPNGVVGSIDTSGSSTSYLTSSDYRLKENVVDIADGIARVKQLQPRRFNFIADADRAVDGFLAHEAQTVVPEAVTGTHNEVDDDDNPVYQGIDQSKLVPLLTAALQEAIAKIETLEAKVAALEAA